MKIIKDFNLIKFSKKINSEEEHKEYESFIENNVGSCFSSEDFRIIGSNIFNSLGDGVAFLKDTLENPENYNKELIRGHSHFDNFSTNKKRHFSGNITMKEAVDKLENWHDTKVSTKNMNDIECTAKKLVKYNSHLKQTYKLKNSFSGAANVPKYLKNLPKHSAYWLGHV